VLSIVNAGALAIEPGVITRIGSTGQRSCTIGLVISGPGQGVDLSELQRYGLEWGLPRRVAQSTIG
jgi:hypothetical protein